MDRRSWAGPPPGVEGPHRAGLRAELGEPLQAEGEPDAAVVAVAAEHAGQAVVPAAAADLDRPRVGRRPPARRSSANRSRCRGRTRGRARPGRSMPCLRQAVDQLVQAGDRLRRDRGERAVQPAQDVRRPARAGRRGRGPGRGLGPGSRASEWPRSHLRRSRWMISWPDRRPVTSGTRWRNSRSMPRSSARLTGRDDRRPRRGRSGASRRAARGRLRARRRARPRPPRR